MTFIDGALLTCGVFMIGFLLYLFWATLEEEFGFNRG